MLNDEFIYTILSSLAYHAPVIRSWGVTLDKVIWLSAVDENIALKNLANTSSGIHVFNSIGKPGNIYAQAKDSNGEMMVFNFQGVSSSYRRLVLKDLMTTVNDCAGTQGKDGYFGVPLLLGKDNLDIDNTMLLSVGSAEMSFSFADVYGKFARPENYGIVRCMAEKHFSDQLAGMSLALGFAAAMFIPELQRMERTEIVDELITDLCTLDDDNLDMQEPEGIIANVQKAFYEWIMHGGRCYRLPRLGMCAVKDFDTALYFDDFYVYATEAFLRKLLGEISVHRLAVVNIALKNAGVLLSKESGTYLAHMRYENLGGECCRKRMLKFAMSRLTRPGYPYLAEIFKEVMM